MVLTPKRLPGDERCSHSMSHRSSGPGKAPVGTLVPYMAYKRIVTFWNRGDFCMMHMQVSFLAFFLMRGCPGGVSAGSVNTLPLPAVRVLEIWRDAVIRHIMVPKLFTQFLVNYYIVFQLLSHCHSIWAQSAVSPWIVPALPPGLSSLCPSWSTLGWRSQSQGALLHFPLIYTIQWHLITPTLHWYAGESIKSSQNPNKIPLNILPKLLRLSPGGVGWMCSFCLLWSEFNASLQIYTA